MERNCSNRKRKSSNEMVNPFVHTLELGTTYEKLKAGMLTVVVLPFRLAIISSLLVAAWILAVVGLLGVSPEQLAARPIAGWRRKVKEMIAWLMCRTYQVGGMTVTIRGEQASRAEAPILVIAPHSTFLDAGIVYVTGFPSIIVRKESGNNPWLGKLINYTQPVYVRREDPRSRHETIQEIIDRVRSKEDWSQMLIFPEGTCTNRSCLITFKPGAFYPGVPVQPVLIRYPNKLDTVTWTWEGPGALKLIWLTLVQPQSNCEIEFLPVYRPSRNEKRDPKLYANNVRRLMAKELGIPTMDYTYDDCKLVSRAKKLSFTKSSTLLETHRLRIKLGLSRSRAEEKLLGESPFLLARPPSENTVDLNEFCSRLGLSVSDKTARRLFALYDKDDRGAIDLKEYLLSVLLVYKSENKAGMLKLAFQLCGGEEERILREDLELILKLVLSTPDDRLRQIVRETDPKDSGYVDYDNFEHYARKSGILGRSFGSEMRRPSQQRDSEEKSK